ncbi:MAG: hypothetical protein ACR2QH_07590, partial [Geminicoccaceae bacterium]
MHQEAIVAQAGKERVTTPVGKCDDLTAANGALTMHQAALKIRVFGHRISNASRENPTASTWSDLA